MIAAGCFLAAALGAVLLSRRVTGDPVSPAAVVVAAWGATLSLFELGRLHYVQLDAHTWTVIAASLGCLVAGLLAGAAFTPQRRPASEPDGALLCRARAWLPIYALLGLSGMCWYLWNIQRILGWDALHDGARIRVALGSYTIPSTFLFLQFFCVVTPLVALTIRILGQRLRAIDIAGAALCTLATWLSTDRTQFFTLACVSAFVVLYLKGPALPLRQLATGLLVAGAALALNFLAIARWVGKSADASAYLYSTGSYPALHVALHAPPAYTRGLHTFYPIVRLLERAHLVAGPVPSPIFEYATVTSGQPGGELLFNGYTWLNYPYQDWGLAGAFAYAAVIGLLGGVLYARLRADRTRPVVLLLMAEFATALLLSPFVNKFNNTAAWYIAVFTVLPFLVAAGRLRRSTA